MTARFQQSSPSDVKLAQKRAELSLLRAGHAQATAVLQQLRDEIARFERSYHQTLGRRIAELERIEAEIARLSGGYGAEEGESAEPDDYLDGETYKSGETFKNSSANGGNGRVWKSETQDIKALYREVAKAIHPDLAGAGPDNAARHELMLKANRAYAEDDSRTLQEILRNWRRHFPGQPEAGDADGAALALVLRQIAIESQALREVNAKVEQLKKSYVCRFKLRVEESLAAGNDLFAEMIAAADLNIARALRRLADLKGERAQEPAKGPPKQKRALHFSADSCCGELYRRDLASANFSQWKKAGPAIGCVEVEVDQAVRLDVKDEPGLKQLQGLKPNDLQSLFLYRACDADLDNIVHLTGLEELYLCGSCLTDAALLCISSLANLKRIYLYQTGISDRGLFYLHGIQGLRGLTSSGNSITDEGLAIFQKAIPGVKTVSFQWRR